MRSGKILRHSVGIDEQEVFCLIHKPVELPELQPSRFTGRVASWAEHAERRYGDSINPVMTYVEGGPHRVSWIYHEGEDWRTGEGFCTYHIICDCITGVEGNSPRESVATSSAAQPSFAPCRRAASSTTPIERARSWPPCAIRRPATSSSQTPSTSSPSRRSPTSSSSTPGVRRNGRATSSQASAGSASSRRSSSCTPRSSSGTDACWRRVV